MFSNSGFSEAPFSDLGVTPYAVANVYSVTGTVELGNVIVSINTTINSTGVFGTSALGIETVNTGSNLFVTGLAAPGQIGTVSVIVNAVANLNGVQAIGGVGGTLIWGLVDDSQSITWVEVVT
jgi:hypothetical protein